MLTPRSVSLPLVPSVEAPQPPNPAARELKREFRRLISFGRAAAVPEGFAYMGLTGLPVAATPVHTYITCRMTYCFLLGLLSGMTDLADDVDHGLSALRGPLRDRVHGGWLTSTSTNAQVPSEPTKTAYSHAFVLLTASAAVIARRTHGDDELLRDALAVVDDHFWDEKEGLVREAFAADWTNEEPYRGTNSNMHMVEAFLAASDATQNPTYLLRAGRMVERVLNQFARARSWRLAEHYTQDWSPIVEYNRNDPDHPFRPYGVTPGHLFEWARLALTYQHAAMRMHLPVEWPVLEVVAEIYDRAVADGWSQSGGTGFHYTTDFDGRPVSRARMHWVLAEAISAAASMFQATGLSRFAEDYARWWEHANRVFVDYENGSWHHELDRYNRVTAGTWPGKPDLYHSVQATLVAQLPLGLSFPAGLQWLANESV